MDGLWYQFFLLVVGALGALVGSWLNLPGDVFTGALLSTAILSLSKGAESELSDWIGSLARILLGVSIGARVNSEMLATVAEAAAPVGGMVLVIMLTGYGVAHLLHRFAGLDLPTALCGSSAGGLSAMVALSDDLGGDPPLVASMHLVRLVSVLLFLPTFVTLAFGSPSDTLVLQGSPVDGLLGAELILLCSGLTVGLIMRRVGVPSGDLLGGIVIAAILNPLWLKLPTTPEAWSILAQLVLGSVVGCSVTRETLRDFKPYALAGAIMTVTLIFVGLSVGYSLSRATQLDLVTALVGSAPGGGATLMVLAGGLGADVQIVAAMHVSRMLMLIVLQPALVQLTMRAKDATLFQES